MRSKIQQWGNSLALRIPKPFAEQVGLRRHAEVEVSLVDGKLVVFPVKGSGPILETLLAEESEENLHSEVDTGPAVGREV